VAGIIGHRLHAIEIERLAIEDVIREPLLQQLDQEFRGSAATKRAFTPSCFIICFRYSTNASAIPPAPPGTRIRSS